MPTYILLVLLYICNWQETLDTIRAEREGRVDESMLRSCVGVEALPLHIQDLDTTRGAHLVEKEARRRDASAKGRGQVKALQDSHDGVVRTSTVQKGRIR